MKRGLVFAAVMTGMTAMTANTFAAASAARSEKLADVLKTKAQHIFDMCDNDHDHGLNHEEQETAARQAYKVFKQLKSNNVLGGPRIPLKVAQPKLLNPDSVTVEEFVEFFELRAAQYDAQVRAVRFAYGNQPLFPPIVITGDPSVQPSGHYHFHHVHHHR